VKSSRDASPTHEVSAELRSLTKTVQGFLHSQSLFTQIEVSPNEDFIRSYMLEVYIELRTFVILGKTKKVLISAIIVICLQCTDIALLNLKCCFEKNTTFGVHRLCELDMAI
jgi:hypothetical protein